MLIHRIYVILFKPGHAFRRFREWYIVKRSSWSLIGLSKNSLDSNLILNPLWNHAIIKSRDLGSQIEISNRRGFLLMTFQEAMNLRQIVKRTSELTDSKLTKMADIGVYNGGSTLIMAESDSLGRVIQAFDTFNGIVGTSKSDGHLKDGDIKGGSVHEFRKNLKFHLNKIEIIQGTIPETLQNLPKEYYSFINLDLDLYQPTYDSLKFFWPTLIPGGCILLHDYNSLSTPGITLAVDTFFHDKKVHLIELWHTQILVIKPF